MKQLTLKQLIEMVKNDNNLVAKVKIANILYNFDYDTEEDIFDWIELNFKLEKEKCEKLTEEFYDLLTDIHTYKNY